MTPSLHRLLILSLCSAAAGCGLIKVNGAPARGGAASSSSTASSSSGGETNTPDGADPELVKLFLSVSWKDFDPTGYVGAGTVATSGLKLGASHSRGPRMGKPIYAVSPDATWLPGWNPRQGEKDLQVQLAQAGINRTWQAQCFADFTAYRAGWATLEETYRPKLAAARAQPNSYTRAAALRELYASVGADAARAGLEVDARHPARWIGVRWEITAALLADIDATRRGFARAYVLDALAADLEPLRAHGRAWTSDTAFERDAFCAAAQDHGTQATPRLPRPRQSGWDLAPVAFPVTDARKAEIAKQVTALVAADRPRLEQVAPADPSTMPPPTAPVLASFNPEQRPFVIERVQPEPERTIVHARRESASAYGYACRSNKQIVGFNGSQPLYGTDCKTGTETQLETVEVTFDELPPDATPRKGDTIRFYGDVVRKTSKSSVKNGGAIKTSHTSFEVTGRYVVSLGAK